MKASDFAIENFKTALDKIPFRAYSTHTEALSFHLSNILLPYHPTRPRSIFKCTTVTLSGLTRLTKLAQEAFTQKHWCPPWRHYTKNEKYYFAASILKENVMSFLAQCLMDPEVPLTTNLISFLLDIAVKLTINNSGRAQVSMLLFAFTEKVKLKQLYFLSNRKLWVCIIIQLKSSSRSHKKFVYFSQNGQLVPSFWHSPMCAWQTFLRQHGLLIWKFIYETIQHVSVYTWRRPGYQQKR